jgi:spermidine synthase
MNPDRISGVFLLAAVFVIAVCGLVYELIAGALSSYLLGSSVTQFSVVIGVFLTAMGLGSYATRFVRRRLLETFLGLQIGIGLTGGFSAAVLLFAFSALPMYTPFLVGTLLVTGTMVGMEIPLLIRILKERDTLRVTVANVLALDYVGALVASLAFPLVLTPYLGMLRTSFLFGLLNVGVAALGLRALKSAEIRARRLKIWAAAAAIALLTGFAGAGTFSSFTEAMLYQDEIILTRQTPYQRLTVTRWRNDVRLFIDGNLQFSSIDEHRYHEALTHPAMCATPHARRVLILGGGDGMAAREALKHPSIERVDLVDLDAEMIALFRDHPALSALSDRALSHPKLRIHIDDAAKFIENADDSWDVILIDLPDPNNFSLARLYTVGFYKAVVKRLAVNGAVTAQATSPYYGAEAFRCVVKTWEETPTGPNGAPALTTLPYHAYVPSFGDWGFVMSSRRRIDPSKLTLPPGIPLKFLDNETMRSLFVFPKDMPTHSPGIRANRMDDQVIVKLYRSGWRRYGP